MSKASYYLLLALLASFLLAACGSKATKIAQSSGYNKAATLSTTPKQSPFLSDKKPRYKVVNTGFKTLYIKSRIFNYYNFAVFNTTNTLGATTIWLYADKKRFGRILVGPKNICFLKSCYNNWVGNRALFGPVSYDLLLYNIVNAKDIYDGLGMVLGPKGEVTQRFMKNGEMLFYRRSKGEIFFQNFTRDIIISIKDYMVEIPNE